MISSTSLPTTKTGKLRAWDEEWVAEAMGLYAIGVPAEAIAKDFGLSKSALRSLAHRHRVKRPSPAEITRRARVARTERIRRHIADYPNRSLFTWKEAA